MNLPTIPKEVLSILNIAAPTLATALGGPLAGAAATVVVGQLSKWLGPELVNSPLEARADQVIKAITDNLGDPDIVPALKASEKTLQKYEEDMQISFAKLAQQERESNRKFQTDTGIAGDVFKFGKLVVFIAFGSLFALCFALLATAFGLVRFPSDNANIIIVTFSIISGIISSFTTWAGFVFSFYFSRSADSDKNASALQETLQTQGAQLGQAVAQAAQVASDAAAKAPVPAPAPQVVVVPAPAPATPSSPAIITPGAPPAWQQGPYGGARWQVLPDGILVEGDAGIARTVGEPVTVRKVWREYGDLIRAECLKTKVPIEVVVMTICTENGSTVPNRVYNEKDGRQSVGIMQVLLGTASEVLGRPVHANDLKEPAVSIAAGVGYILKQKPKTWFDPILTSAAYNAGGLYELRSQDSNRFNLRSTGDHLERAIRWYGDVCFVAKADGWFNTP